MAVRSQNTDDFIYALSCCRNQLGGVPQTLVPDNLKSAFIKSSRYEQDIDQALAASSGMPTIVEQLLLQPVREAARQDTGGKPGKTGLQPGICPVTKTAVLRPPPVEHGNQRKGQGRQSNPDVAKAVLPGGKVSFR